MITIRKLIAKSCTEIGIPEILDAADGGNAWQLLSSNPHAVKLVISEWELPEGTGMELLKRIRTDARFEKLSFIMTTTGLDPVQVQAITHMGYSGVLNKPFNSAALAEKIREIQKK